jgi:sarcosine oxidase subunit beta
MNAPSRSRYRVAIVGAGVIGLFTAWHLARAGVRDVLVVDRGFLSSGASGRNGGGIRQQWETSATVRLARESVLAYRRFGRDFGDNVWFRQGGYLFLAETPEELERLRTVQRVVAIEGLPAIVLDPGSIPRYAPGLDLTRVVGATFLASDGAAYVAEPLNPLGVSAADIPALLKAYQ